MAELLSYILVVVSTLLTTSAIRRTGELLAEGGWDRIRADTIDRNDQKDNQQVLNSIRNKEQLIEQKEEKIEGKNQEISEIRDEKEELENRLSDFERITNSLKKDSLARQRLIERYWQPLHAVIICFAEQENSDDDSETWLRDILEERYSLHNLTGFTCIIPPTDVPSQLKGKQNSREKLKNWIENDVYDKFPDAKSTICFAGVVDLRNVYSRTDYEKENRTHLFSTIDEELSLEDIFNEDDFSKLLASDGVNLSKIIEEGDIPFLASKAITSDELEKLHTNQEVIESNLGSPNLREIATEVDVSTLSEVLQSYISAPDRVASSIKQEAKIWEREL